MTQLLQKVRTPINLLIALLFITGLVGFRPAAPVFADAPVYCTSTATQSGVGFVQVQLNGQSQNSAADSLYVDYTGSPLTTLTIGETYILQVTTGSEYPQMEQYVRAWIDFNQDGDFSDAGEAIDLGDGYDSDEVFSQSFTVPVMAGKGSTRMRVSIEDGSVPASCGSITSGEVEDYQLGVDGNQPPVNHIPGPFSISSAGTLTFTGSTAITITDPDAGNDEVLLNLSVDQGDLTLSQTTGLVFENPITMDGSADAVMGINGSLADINAALDGMFYTPPATPSGTTMLTVETNDLGHNGAGTGRDTLDTAVIYIDNHAPVLDTADPFALPSVVSHDARNVGVLVEQLLGSAVTDADAGQSSGLAVIGVDNTHGSWQYSLDAGQTWTDFGAPDTAHARLLAADGSTLIHFVSAEGYTGTIDSGITFRAWDQTLGVNGGELDATTVGDSSPFSLNSATASIVVRAARLFDPNGGFEDGDFSGWTVSHFYNESLILPQPFTGDSINRRTDQSAPSLDQSILVGGLNVPPLSGTDPDQGKDFPIALPRYGHFTARVNGPIPDNNANELVQTSTVTADDVDPVDDLVHLRFVYAPVLENPGHNPQDQPYFYVGVKNLSELDNSGKPTILYDKFAFAGQAGVPWQTYSGSGSELDYTDWQVVDIPVGTLADTLGDQIQLEVVASGCAQGGHAGWVYVDSFGSQLPGLSITATAAKTADRDSDLAYTFIYRNSGDLAVNNVVVTETLPAHTTFVSVSDQDHCAEVDGVVTCSFPSLAAGASGTFTLTVHIDGVGNTAPSINNGDYAISGDDNPALLGPVAVTTLPPLPANLGIAYTQGSNTYIEGDNNEVGFTVVITNHGTNPVNGVSLVIPPVAGLSEYYFLCDNPSEGSSCTSEAQADLLPGGTVEFLIATYIDRDATGVIQPVVTTQLPEGYYDTDTQDDAITVTIAPLDFGLSNTTLTGSQLAGALVGKLTTNDRSGVPVTYDLVSGTGDEDNDRFVVSEDELHTSTSLDIDAQTSYHVRLQFSLGEYTGISKAFVITLVKVNQPPVLAGLGDVTVDHSMGPVVLPFTVDDPDTALDQLTLAVHSSDQALLPDSSLSLDGAGKQRTLQVQLPAEKTGQVQITVTVDDGYVPLGVATPIARASKTFTLTIIAGQVVDSGGELQYQLPAFSGLTGDQIEYVVTLADGAPLPGWLTFDPATHTFSGTPSSNDAGIYTLKVVATDGQGGTAFSTFKIQVWGRFFLSMVQNGNTR